MTDAPADALVVADDLTGATDTGHSFAARGYRTVVRVDDSFSAPEAAVSVVDTDSRYADAEVAAERVASAVSGTAADAVYKKIDSTLRGNVRAETVAARDAMGADAAAVAPAFPANGRVTAAGYHLVDGALVTDTEPGNDPDSPVPTAYLPDLLGGAAVSHADVGRVAAGGAGDALDDARIVAFDAVHDSHLRNVADAALSEPGEVLLVGSAGLAEHVRLDAPTRERAPRPGEAVGTAFGVAGSVSERTLAQLDAVGERVVKLDPERAVTDPAGAGEAAAAACRERLTREPSAVLASARAEGDVETALDAAERAGIDERAARERVTAALATGAAAVYETEKPDGLFLTGGTVAKAVLGELGVGGVELHGEEIAAGVPLGTARGGPADGTAVVTKAGAFGEVGTIADALERLHRMGKG
jgi:uncharacterized protein YgbK (DUF1537 family)